MEDVYPWLRVSYPAGKFSGEKGSDETTSSAVIEIGVRYDDVKVALYCVVLGVPLLRRGALRTTCTALRDKHQEVSCEFFRKRFARRHTGIRSGEERISSQSCSCGGKEYPVVRSSAGVLYFIRTTFIHVVE